MASKKTKNIETEEVVDATEEVVDADEETVADETVEVVAPVIDVSDFIPVLEDIVGGLLIRKAAEDHPKLDVAISHARSCRDRIKEVVGV